MILNAVRTSRAGCQTVTSLDVAQTAYPVAGLAVQVRDGHDDDCISILGVYQAVWEAAEQRTSQAGRQFGA